MRGGVHPCNPAGCRVPGWWCRKEGDQRCAICVSGSHLQQRSRGTARAAAAGNEKKRGRGVILCPLFIFERGDSVYYRSITYITRKVEASAVRLSTLYRVYLRTAYTHKYSSCTGL